MLREEFISEVEAILTAAGQEVRGAEDVRELRRRLAAALGSPEPRLCPPPCRDRGRRLDQHVRLGGRCCETRATWWVTTTRGLHDGQVASLTGLIILLAERPDNGELEAPLRALAGTLLAEGFPTPPEDCGFGGRP